MWLCMYDCKSDLVPKRSSWLPNYFVGFEEYFLYSIFRDHFYTVICFYIVRRYVI